MSQTVETTRRPHSYAMARRAGHVRYCRKLVVLQPVGKFRPLLRWRCQLRLCVLVELDAGGPQVLLQVPHR